MADDAKYLWETFDRLTDFGTMLPPPNIGDWTCGTAYLNYKGHAQFRVADGKFMTLNEAKILCAILNANGMRPV